MKQNLNQIELFLLTSLPMAIPLYVGLRVPLHYLDALQQNDLLAVRLQDASQGKCSENIIYLYGGFQTSAGEQVLVLGPSHHIPHLSSNALLAHLSSWTADTTNCTHQFYNALIVSHKKHQMQNCQLFNTAILQVPFRAFFPFGLLYQVICLHESSQSLGFGWAFHLGQWLACQDDGRITAADYAKEAAQATAEGRAVGEWEFWDCFDKSRPIQRHRHFITKLLRGTFKGLAFMHASGRLHQSLGPASVVIK